MYEGSRCEALRHNFSQNCNFFNRFSTYLSSYPTQDSSTHPPRVLALLKYSPDSSTRHWGKVLRPQHPWESKLLFRFLKALEVSLQSLILYLYKGRELGVFAVKKHPRCERKKRSHNLWLNQIWTLPIRGRYSPLPSELCRRYSSHLQHCSHWVLGASFCLPNGWIWHIF